MLYGILTGNKLHLSEIARSLNETISLKKTIERLSRNLRTFHDQNILWANYLSLVKKQVKDDYAVIVVDNSDLVKPSARKMEALTEVRDGSTGEIRRGYQTIEASILSEAGKLPLPVYQKKFSPAEADFISETGENLSCLRALSDTFSPRCIRTLDRGFDANVYFRYFLKGESISSSARRTGMSSIAARFVTSWMSPSFIKGISA